MNTVFPLRFRRLPDQSLIFANEAGQFFKSDDAFLNRLSDQNLTQQDNDFLSDRAMSSAGRGDLNETAFLHRLSGRMRTPSELSYLILVPTLRCDLACSYCQVSRAALNAKGFDWSEETLSQVLTYIDTSQSDKMQVEFQGGEPTLRLDLMKSVIAFCRSKFKTCRFIVCTNLSTVSSEFLDLVSHDDVFVSSSMDGSPETHKSQRTNSDELTSQFFKNFEDLAKKIGGRLSALPTLNSTNLPEPSDFIEAFDRFNMRSIYLRPIVYHGFARKQHSESRNYQNDWQKFYEACVFEMIERNSKEIGRVYEEYYLTLVLKRLLRAGEDNHIDLRTPNWLGYDHQLIDYDGRIYPSDEARMIARTGQADLSIGTVSTGLNYKKRDELQARAFNALDPWCSQCPYQAACGSDPIDDLARHGRADVPKPATVFWQKHLHMFDFAMGLIFSKNPKVQRSLASWLGLPTSTALGEILS